MLVRSYYPVASMPISAEGFVIPASLLSPSASLTGWPREKPATACWDCGAPLQPGRFGPYQLCAGCRNGKLQEARENRYRERMDDE